MTEDDLDKLSTLDKSASAGPWFVRFLDDDMAMSAVAISLSPDTGLNECMRSDEWPGHDLIAATLVQHPPYVLPDDSKWRENAALIVALRNGLPELLRLAKKGLKAT